MSIIPENCKRIIAFALAGMVAALAGPAWADSMLAGFEYPFPVKRFEFTSQQTDMSMAYMDIAPDEANGRTVVLLHGKNFCGATWARSMRSLREAGYRVIVPDQIGFCKSTKPKAYQFGLHQLAANTKALLDSVNVENPIIMGHSMGGMLAARYALRYPEPTAALVMVNPIGLEDWKAKGVPVPTVDQLYAGQLKTTAESLRAYQKSTYYAGEWRPRYDRWVEMLASMFRGDGRDIVAWNHALTADMIINQPVIYEFDNIAVPTLLLIGEQDTTAIGKNSAPPKVKESLGNYPALGRKAADRIPDATLHTFPDLGHSPHIQAPAQFHEALLKELDALATDG